MSKNLHFALILAIILLLAFSGCTAKKPVSDTNSNIPVPVQQQTSFPDITQDSNGLSTNASSNRVVKSPISCNDLVIVKNVKEIMGKDYGVYRGPPVSGQTFYSANCFVRYNGTPQFTFSILEQPDENTAIRVIEDERTQYEQQLFEKSSGQYSIGLLGYIFEQTTKAGSLYRIIFVDSSNAKVAVFIKSNTEVDRSKVELLAQALEKSI